MVRSLRFLMMERLRGDYSEWEYFEGGWEYRFPGRSGYRRDIAMRFKMLDTHAFGIM